MWHNLDTPLVLYTLNVFYTLVLSVEFDQMVYSGSEESGIISVTLSLKGGTSSYDISVTVMPSDQSPVSAEGKYSVCYTCLLVFIEQVELTMTSLLLLPPLLLDLLALQLMCQ